MPGIRSVKKRSPAAERAEGNPPADAVPERTRPESAPSLAGQNAPAKPHIFCLRQPARVAPDPRAGAINGGMSPSRHPLCHRKGTEGDAPPCFLYHLSSRPPCARRFYARIWGCGRWRGRACANFPKIKRPQVGHIVSFTKGHKVSIRGSVAPRRKIRALFRESGKGVRG